MKLAKRVIFSVGFLLFAATTASAGEADLALPDLTLAKFTIAGIDIDGWHLLLYGALVITGTLGISLYLRSQIAKLTAHQSMLDVAEIIFQTCKTYLIQQGKFLLMLFAFIASAMTYYFMSLQGESLQTALLV